MTHNPRHFLTMSDLRSGVRWALDEELGEVTGQPMISLLFDSLPDYEFCAATTESLRMTAEHLVHLADQIDQASEQ